MEAVSDVPQVERDGEWTTIRPFGPSIIHGQMSPELQKVLCGLFEQQGAKKELPPEEDNQVGGKKLKYKKKRTRRRKKYKKKQ